MSPAELEDDSSYSRLSLAEHLEQLKLRAMHVQVLKLLAAPEPVSMPAAFREALRLLRVVEQDG